MNSNEKVYTNIGTTSLTDASGATFAIQQASGIVPTQYFFMNDGVHLEEITRAQAFVQDVWLHFTYGLPLRDASAHPLVPELVGTFHITPDAMMLAIAGVSSLHSHLSSMTEQDITNYVVAEVPGVLVNVVGVPLA